VASEAYSAGILSDSADDGQLIIHDWHLQCVLGAPRSAQVGDRDSAFLQGKDAHAPGGESLRCRKVVPVSTPLKSTEVPYKNKPKTNNGSRTSPQRLAL